MHSTIAGEDRRLSIAPLRITAHYSPASSEPIFSFYFIFACNCVSNKNPIMSTPLYIYLLMGEYTYTGKEGRLRYNFELLFILFRFFLK